MQTAEDTKKYHREYWAKNKEKYIDSNRIRSKLWSAKNRERKRELQREWSRRNTEKIRKYQLDYKAKKRMENR